MSGEDPREAPARRGWWRHLGELRGEAPEDGGGEFPEGASQLPEGLSRRGFVRLMSASMLLAGVGLSGCRRPEETIVPFTRMPEGYVHGVARYFATAMPDRDSAVPLLAKSHEGRPVKLEGNPEHPLGGSGTEIHAQASLLDLYDPDRSRGPLRNGEPVAREQALEHLASLAARYASRQGRGLAVLASRSSSPTRQRLRELWAERLPHAGWHEYEAVDFGLGAQAARLAYGEALRPRFRFERAARILSLDCDFLGDEQDARVSTRGFARGRALEDETGEMSRLYVAEALMTLTGSSADHRLRIKAGRIPAVAGALLLRLVEQEGDVPGISEPLRAALARLSDGLEDQDGWIGRAMADLRAHKGRSLVVAGYRQPLEVHLIALLLNRVLGGEGETVEYLPDARSEAGTIAELRERLEAGQVETLVVLGGNPAYDAPAGLDWSAAQRKAGEVVRLGCHQDETSEGAGWHLPQAHFLETWGDARTLDGTRVAVQPLIAPLFGGLSDIEVAARLLGEPDPRGHSLVRATFDRDHPSGGDQGWKRFLHDGFLPPPGTGAAPSLSVRWPEVRRRLENAPLPPSGSLEVVFHRDACMDDGRYSNNGWLQELPDPVTKLTWDNVVLVSRRTAQDAGVANGDVVRIEAGGASVEGPVFVQPGLADQTLGLALGYGRRMTGRIGRFDGQAVGFDAYPLRREEGAYLASGASMAPAGSRHLLAHTQDHWSMEGRAIVREANLSRFREKNPGFASDMGVESHLAHIKVGDQEVPELYQHPYEERPSLKSGTHQWGMAIDLNRCTGCSACVIACQSENNIPIVGKEQVANSREMHWMRIDRYYAGGAEARAGASSLASDSDYQNHSWIDDPQVVSQPMLCQHCESAPCESVCPVNATVHDHEGLNVMVYNRCVGTRYCSNNCAWKVRRFNFFDYNKRPLEDLYQGPLAKRPQDELDLASMARNPDVSVRMRGVMEKCTFCVQRIEEAKIARKVAARDSGDTEVPDGTIRTACEQACPAEAIVFGNLAGSEKSRVSRWKENPRNYAVLGYLDTRPRTTYLARVRNPNPEMPDYREDPLSLEEYSEKMGNPFDKDNGGAGHGGGH